MNKRLEVFVAVLLIAFSIIGFSGSGTSNESIKPSIFAGLLGNDSVLFA